MTSIATFCNAPVSAVFDSTVATSSFSLRWVVNSGIPTQNSRASGFLSLPCDAGDLSMFLDNICVSASSPSDLVLGLDWFHFACRSTSATILVHLNSGLLELRPDRLPTSARSAVSVSTGSLSASPVLHGGVDLVQYLPARLRLVREA
ncbi:hypothetical protein DFH06DRAFT_1470769 [Mycena polygramma]|nr:hypothetical protein DFH06DRAFT_1470769 [Mycena polygramma]